MGSKGKWHLGLEEGATAAGQESQRLLGPGRIRLWDFTSQDELPPGIRKGEQWGGEWKLPFPFPNQVKWEPSKQES